ncbi:MAG: cytochrome P450 [bacterium]|nr:cytochrome P450 [bacterium]
MTTQSYRLPPGPPPIRNPLSLLRFMLAFQGDFFGIIDGGFDQYGDSVTFEAMGSRTVILRHPEHIHEVTTRQADKFHKEWAAYKDPKKGMAKFLGNGLLTSDGEFWKRQRKLMSPAFHYRRIASYGEIMTAEADGLIREWAHKRETDVDHDMMRATLSIVARSLFHSDMSDADVRRIGGGMDVLQQFSSNPVAALLPAWVPLPSRQREAQALRDLDEVVYRVIAQHRAMGGDNGDLLWMLLDARDDDGRGMTDQQIRDELVTLFLAGHDTTANTLNWTWVLLAQHPEKEAKLHAELDRVLAGRTPTLADLKQLPYTDQVIKESMRLYPPAFTFSRQATADVQVGGYDLPKDTVVTVMSYAVHRDARWYPDPLKFEPERWTPEFESSLPKGAYIPFGGGPRICIGFNFALMEAQILLAALASRYQLRLKGAAPTPDPLLTLRPKGGLHMQVIPRTPQYVPAEDLSAVVAE